MERSLSQDNPSLSCNNKKPLGQLLNEAGLISAQQIEIALRDQLDSPKIRIGELFAMHGWIDQNTADFFVEEWDELLSKKQKYPLVYYLRKAGLLSEDEINLVLEEQKLQVKKVRFHNIAVKKGLIKQQTIDFLIKNLLSKQHKKSSCKSSFATPYELLKNYIRGETNFQRSEFKRIKLNSVTLKGVNFNHSNFIEAELKQANLSNSSLKSANLSYANLEKAILKEVNFTNACLNSVNLTDAHLEGANFQQADLKQADLRHCYLVNVYFQGADLRFAKLQDANLKGAVYNHETSFDPEFDPNKRGMKLV